MNEGYFKRTPGSARMRTIPIRSSSRSQHNGRAPYGPCPERHHPGHLHSPCAHAGYQTRWILGTDHAGISTQTKVDKKLADQGISRLEIGREAFIEACYDWYKEYGTTIVNQIKGMGCSCDYADETSRWSRPT